MKWTLWQNASHGCEFFLNYSVNYMYLKKLLNTCWVIGLVCCTSLINAMELGKSSTSLTQEALVTKKNSKVNDGPYVFKLNNSLDAVWLCDAEIYTKSMKAKSLPQQLDSQCGISVHIDRVNFPAIDVLEYKGDFSVVASSDFHGQYGLMMQLLKNNNIVDENGHWSFEKGHFVITGDVFDRGDKVTEILWFLYHLEKEAELAGGKLHLLLGNHEVMVLNGDLRYLHPKYVEVAKRLEKPFESLFGKNTILGDWLRAKPVLVKINGMLFAHGGFHPSLAQEKRTLNEINSVFKHNLVKAEMETPREGWGKFLHKTNGPIWYRGYFNDDGATEVEIELLLNHFDINYLVVGHTSQQQIETRYQNRVIAIDTSIKNGKYGELLIVTGESIWRATLQGKRVRIN